ncbi:MAG: hypothetical protein JXR63_03960 [Spirochaetales bacterium]|nr:hypothetical protein [Spirochaetales bacterium]
MKANKIGITALTIVNIIWLSFSVFMITEQPVAGLIMLIPLGISLITFFIIKVVKKKTTFKALKYANLAFFIPAGIISIILSWYINSLPQSTIGFVIDLSKTGKYIEEKPTRNIIEESNEKEKRTFHDIQK